MSIVIAGGGMVGVSLALALRHKLPDVTLTLVESFPLPEPGATTSTYTPSFDARSTALSYGSALIYGEWGVWDAIRERAAPIESIHVSEQGRFGSTLMRAADYDWPALGYVVENAWLGNCLLEHLYQRDIHTLSPAKVVAARSLEPVSLQLDDGSALDAELLVVADGADSGLRDALGIGHRRQLYGQHAVIANIAHRESHQGRAYERFTPNGPLAMLPLTDEGAHRSALVWTLSPQQAEAMLAAPEQEFLTTLQREFGYRLGRLERVGERHHYPLALVEAEEQVRQGVVVMGNAAHSLHPVAGQGFNLALRDVACLAATLAAASAAGQSAGSLGVLQSYREQQKRDQQQTTLFSDRLPGLFSHRDLALSALRDLGLAVLDLTPSLKREFVRQTAGLSASRDYRDARP